MKKFLAVGIISLVLIFSCKEDKKIEIEKIETVETEMSIPEQIAKANGFTNWDKINTIKFTFNVDRGSSHFERTWSWAPKTNDVIFTTREDTISYNRSSIDSVLAKTDAGFINDKFWLLAPYQLVWDQDGYTFEHTPLTTAPMSKESMQKLTIIYHQEGGYTPGDAYDFFFSDDFIIKEWAFRKGNQEVPNMVTSWEGYQDYKGLHMATMHKRNDEDFKLYFTSIEVN